MMEDNVTKQDLREVIEYEIQYREKAHQAEFEKTEQQLHRSELAEKDAEIANLKAKLKENGIE